MGVKISALPAIAVPALTDVFPVVQGGVTYKETMTQLKSLFNLPATTGPLNTLLRSDGTNYVASTATTLDASDNLAGLSTVKIGTLKITGSGNIIESTNTNGYISILTNGEGNLRIGSNTTTSSDSQVQIATDGQSSNLDIGSFTNNASASSIYFLKSRSPLIGSYTAVQAGDSLSDILTYADDGTSFIQTARVLTQAVGPISTGKIGGQIKFFTSLNTTGASALAMTITTEGNVVLANPLLVASGGSGRASSTPYALIAGSTTSTGIQQSLTTGTSGQILTSAGASSLPDWTTATFSGTYAASTLLYSNGANTVTGLATANNGVLVTSGSGVPSISTTLPSGLAATNINLTTPTLGVANATSINFGGSALANYVSGGTWTPVFTFSTPGNLSVAYTTQVGFYTRIGNIVQVNFRLVCTPTYTTASQGLIITGLPFTSNSTANNFAIGTANLSSVAYPVLCTNVCSIITNSSAQIQLQGNGSNTAAVTFSVSQFPTGVVASMSVTISYLV